MSATNKDGLLLLERVTLEDALEFFLCDGPHERHKVEALDEGVKLEQINLIIRRMLESIRVKQDTLDVRSIDNSKGDVRHVKDYDNIHNAIRQIRQIANGPHPVDDLIELEGYILKYSEAFKMAYDNENIIGIWFYEGCVLDLFYGTMLVIAQSIRSVKVSTGIRLEADLSSNIAANYSIQNIRGKNRLFRESKVTLALNASGPFLQEFAFTSILGGIALGVVAVFTVVYVTRYTVMQYYNLRRYIAGEFKIVAAFLELNALTMDNQSTAAKQEALAKKLNDLSDAIRVKNTTAEGTTKADVKREILPELKREGINHPQDLIDLDDAGSLL